ncbi:HET-domain-containing protein [Lentithecium fluviatile CBS 122367]|uniref:HET-domain-containing protein n=1 Tax=Lentithecium fluviatile CBS 122367 TaxID=1168545 RepID=A0A6G1IHG5_9PLEO|nr:HET-domain-containing protein [Lentithecium fluviatile CBS 122367]
MAATDHIDSSKQLSQYQYQPLTKANEIRLLRIPCKAPDAPWGQAVDYALFHVILGDGNQYAGLSYSWGDPKAANEITVNGRSMHITESLATALYNLQRKDKDVVLWADAICINQKDPVEMTAQVQLMRQIYKTAEHVFVWLGPATPDTNRSMQETRRLGSQLLQAGMWDLTSDDITRWTSAPNIDSSAARTKRQVMAIANDLFQKAQDGEFPFWWITSDLGQRAWWSRMWCIQELSNAREAIFRAGQEEVDFKAYWAVTLFIQIFNGRALMHPTNDVMEGKQIGWLTSLLAEAFPVSFLGIRRKTLLERGHNLRTLLHTSSTHDSDTARFGATDPRDRVYALLGIANDDAAKGIVADYTLPCEDAYIVAARALLKHGHDDILSLCRKRNVCKDLPSWVPDWTAMNRKPWSTWRQERMFNASNVPETFQGLYRNPPEHDSMLSREITLRVAFVDIVEDIGQVWSIGIEDNYDYDAARHFFDDLSRYLSHSTRYNALQKKEAEWRLPIGDTQITNLTSQVERAPAVSQMQIGYNVLRKVANEEAEPGDILRERRSYGCYLSQMGRMHDSRPFFSKTGYVGVCPMETQPDDSVVVILGARVPYIVRKKERSDAWTLIGESHVYGIMDGEFMREDPIPTMESIKLN